MLKLLGMLLDGITQVGLLLHVVHVVRDEWCTDHFLRVRVSEDGLFDEASKLVLCHFLGEWAN